MAKKLLRIELAKLASQKNVVPPMVHELEGKSVLNAASKPRWGVRFAASGLKSAPKRP
jgi:hypothetical protein